MKTRVIASLCFCTCIFLIARIGFCDDDLSSGGNVLAPGARSSHSPIVWHLGVEAGVTYTMLNNNNDSTLFSMVDPYKTATPFYRTVLTGSGVGFHVGLSLDALLSDRWAIEAKLQYASLHAKLSHLNKEPCPIPGQAFVDTAIVDDEVAVTLGMLSINALAKYFIVPQSFYAVGGFAFGFNVGKTYDATESITNLDGCSYEDDNGKAVSRSMAMNGTLSNTVAVQINLILGIGDMIPLSDKLYLTPEITVGIPLSGLFSNTYAFPASFPFDANNYGKFYQSGLSALVIYPTIGLKFVL